MTKGDKDYLTGIVRRAEAAAEKARVKFPQPNYVTLKVAEEAGEVVRAAVHYAEGRATWEDLEGEAIQTIAMIFRLLIEGDEINGVKPPARPFVCDGLYFDADTERCFTCGKRH